ncbi:T9SS type A sorting domain-containing protein [Maribellus comscasis]|uniref:T9SS type A sorting domain-containing protein n=1 Tax=Maribellus comscasis TaxID=2681766 RepID=A0A6I6JKV2_9BACT|nr:T9SS type A sorting domain-containing protein [Maribellus comscasis]QGY43426.1 T9SS type A sorting domain-containing protein [Maribellus comscasis]
MKHILLLLIFSFISFAGFSQTQKNESSRWNKTSLDINTQIELKVFPNPCTGQKLTVEIDNEELTELRITNIAGKVVMLKKYLIPVNKVELSLDNTPNGIYLIQIKTTANKLMARKLIVSAR